MSLLVEGEGSPIVTVTLNRPQRFNALTIELVDALTETFTRLSKSSTRVVILTGAGRAFCAGADLQNDQFDSPDMPKAVSDVMEQHYNPMVLAYRSLPCPVIAKVNGVAAGGGASLALMADLCVAARSATFVQVFGPQLGLVPDLGSTWTLPRLVGRARARGLALLGDKLDAFTAMQWGLIWQAVDGDQLDATVSALADRLASGPTSTFTEIGHLLDDSLDRSLEEQLEAEREAQQRQAAHPNFREAVLAFREKRKPRFG